MKKLLTTLAAIVAVVAATGCASTYPMGFAYTNLRMPVAATGEKIASTKVGKATCKSVFGLVTTGDASINTAAKSANITVISHVDWEVENILGVIGTYSCVVYGE